MVPSEEGKTVNVIGVNSAAKAVDWLFGRPTYIVLLALSLFAWWHYLNYTQPALVEKLDAKHTAALERSEQKQLDYLKEVKEERNILRADSNKLQEEATKAHEKFGNIFTEVTNTLKTNTELQQRHARAVEKLIDKVGK